MENLIKKNFQTNRLILEFSNFLLNEKQKKDLFECYSDEEVIKYSGIDKALFYDDLDKIYSEYREKSNFFIWLIFDKENQKYIGDISISICFKHKFGNIGFLLSRNWWRKKIMTESVKTLLYFFFENKILHRVEAQVHELNLQSQKFLESINFSLEAVLKENFFYRGKFYNSYLYRILSYEFKF